MGLLLLAECGLLGLFAAGDLILFYVFWEAMLVPFALLMWMWGSGERGPATLTFVIYTMVGSLLMLVAILSAGVHRPGPRRSADVQHPRAHPATTGPRRKVHAGCSPRSPGVSHQVAALPLPWVDAAARTPPPRSW